MVKADVLKMMRELKKVFKIVRLVDTSLTVRYSVNDEGELEQPFCRCYTVWNKERNCEDCIALKIFSDKNQMAKFEFIGEEVYYVISKYVEMDGIPYMLDLINIVDGETLFNAQGHDQLAMKIVKYTHKIYTDPMTGAYNRRYFEERYQKLNLCVAIAMLDLDNFKRINDVFGHHAGDLALKEIGETVLSKIRADDILIRYGGDEFLLAFMRISRDTFFKKLETIRQAISQITFEGYPEMRVTVSAGGVYRVSEGKVDMVNEADKILYQSKQEKNKVMVELR